MSAATDAPAKAAAVHVAKEPTHEHIPIDHLFESKTNQRTIFDKAKLEELAISVGNHGVIQPIVVRPLPGAPASDHNFEIVAGARRFRASKMAKSPTVPVPQ